MNTKGKGSEDNFKYCYLAISPKTLEIADTLRSIVISDPS